MMKCVSQSVGEVLDLTWTRSGLTICYKNTNVSIYTVNCNFISNIIRIYLHLQWLGICMHVIHLQWVRTYTCTVHVYMYIYDVLL